MNQDTCFVVGCKEMTKMGIVTAKGHEFYACETHEELLESSMAVNA